MGPPQAWLKGRKIAVVRDLTACAFTFTVSCMDETLKRRFLERWQKYFPGAELPIAWYYTDQPSDAPSTSGTEHCLISRLRDVREGRTLVYGLETPGCAGGKRFSGFSAQLRPNFEYFLSCGIPGKLEGERYKKSPELVRSLSTEHPPFKAPAKYLVFTRWDMLDPLEDPLVVVFFATPDVLAGLFTLANYDLATTQGVITPMGSGCSSAVAYPLEETTKDQRCVLGMFDVSARPSVQPGVLTFAVPMQRLLAMLDNMDESFLITPSWGAVRERMFAGR